MTAQDRHMNVTCWWLIDVFIDKWWMKMKTVFFYEQQNMEK